MNIKIAYMVSGQIIIGDYDPDTKVMNKPVTIGQDPQSGKIGLVKYGQLGHIIPGPKSIALMPEHYLRLDDVDKNLEYAWIQATSGIAVASPQQAQQAGMIQL